MMHRRTAGTPLAQAMGIPSARLQHEVFASRRRIRLQSTGIEQPTGSPSSMDVPGTGSMAHRSGPRLRRSGPSATRSGVGRILRLSPRAEPYG